MLVCHWQSCRALSGAVVQDGLQHCWRSNVWGCISRGHRAVEGGPPKDMQGTVGCCLGAGERAALLSLSCSMHALM